VVIRITPGNSGTSKQSQGTTPKSHRAVWCDSVAPTATTNLFVQYLALGDRAARVFYSTNQEAPQNLSIWGGLWRNSQGYIFTAVRKPASNAGTQTIIYTQIGGNK
jgi:hypothetical protein